MKNQQGEQKMGSTNQPAQQYNIQQSIQPITSRVLDENKNIPLQKDKSAYTSLQKIANQQIIVQSQQQPSIISTTINDYRLIFTLSRKQSQIIIKSTSKKNNKKFISNYQYLQLPKAIQITYKSIEEVFDQIKYIIQENIPNRLQFNDQGKFVFYLQTKKKGKSQYLPETFVLEQENNDHIINRLEEDIEKLKAEDNRKNVLISELSSRIAQIQAVLKISHSDRSHREEFQNQKQHNQSFSLTSPLNTIDLHTENQGNASQQSIIKKFKKSQSNQNLNFRINSQNQLSCPQLPQESIVLKTAIKDYDCFISLQNSQLKIELLSRRQAKIYKCIIGQQNIPKSVYSFVPTPQKLYDEIAFIIEKNTKNRIDVVENNFVYRASINQKNQEVLIDGVFQTSQVQQNDLERIEDLVDIKTSVLQSDVRELKISFDMLKISLKCNDIIFQKPQGFFDSKVVLSNEEYITLCKFFKSKFFKIDLLYRASDNNFEIKRFHENCDGIPNTLTLIQTQFGKKIGGFTSEQWDRNGNGKSLSDYSNHSFIFSLTNKHKFTLEQHQYAIQTGSEDGPRFGNGADLVIKDKANENNNSYANICTSYSHPRYTFKNIDSYKSFSGDQKTNRFSIKQWQVFEVFFQQ